jgi:hypothetical protein
MGDVACVSFVGIERLILRSAEGASRRMVQKQRDRRASFRRPLERPSRLLRGVSGEVRTQCRDVSRETHGRP